MRLKRVKAAVLAAMLCASMVVGMTACGGKETTPNVVPNGDVQSNTGTVAPNGDADVKNETVDPGLVSAKTRDLQIGTWWIQYYDSSHTDVTDDPSYSGTLDAELRLAAVRRLEEKYNVRLYWTNLTYEGTKESINNSVLAGTPDCDAYLVDLQFGIPAALNGLALDLKTILPADDDVFTSQKVVSFLDLGDNKACLLKKVTAQSTVEATYPLGFNKQMLENYNLEDPRELYARGEWTWSKFIEYCQVLTKDTDGDGKVDQYGFCGFSKDTFGQLMMSNGANVAAGKTETLSSPAVGETLQLMYDMYNTYNVCYPYDYDGEPWNSMRFQYREGNIGFFPIAAWMNSENADYDHNGTLGFTLPFDTVYVQWPVGPSGNQATNKAKISGGEYYIIPAGVENPEQVYHVLYDYWNWFEGDVELRDDPETLVWWYTSTSNKEEIQNSNFEVMRDCGSRETFDIWDQMGVEMDWNSLLNGTYTPAQFQETYRQQIQDGLDAFFGN